MKKGKVRNRMGRSESGTHWLAGQEVLILEVDDGEGWEDSIVRVKGMNRRGKLETAWININDIVLGATEQAFAVRPKPAA